MSHTGAGQGPRLRPLDKVRVVLIGIVLPLLLIVLTWSTTSSWNDLPDELPSHWGPDGADSFLPPRSIIDAWSIGGLFAAAVAVSATIGAARHWRWSSLGRSVSAVSVGVAGAAASGLFVQMLIARGKTTEAVVDLGLGPSFLALFAGFAAFTVLSIITLPRSDAHESDTER